MPITTSDAVIPGLGGTGKSKTLCWECGEHDDIMVLGPATPQPYCRACAEELGIKPVPIELVGEEYETPAEEIVEFLENHPDVKEMTLRVPPVASLLED